MTTRPLRIDTTLRDGEQAAGVAVSRAGTCAITEVLIAFGRARARSGIPAMGAEACDDLNAIADAVGCCAGQAGCCADEADLEAAHRCGKWAVHLSFPVFEIRLGTR